MIWATVSRTITTSLYVTQHGMLTDSSENPGLILNNSNATLLKETMLFPSALNEQQTDFLLIERQRIARDLHDELGQQLAAIHFYTSGILSAKSAQLSQQYASKIEKLVTEMMCKTASIVKNLHHGITDYQTSMLQLTQMIDAWQAFNTSTRLVFVNQYEYESHGLTPAIVNELYKIILEGLTNISRHAHADTVTIKLLHREDRLILIIKDNGRGFDTSTTPSSRFGLSGMRQRVQLIKGMMTIESKPQLGTLITISLFL